MRRYIPSINRLGYYTAFTIWHAYLFVVNSRSQGVSLMLPPLGMMKHTEFHRLVVRSLCTQVWTSSALAVSCHASICQIVISSSGAQFVDLVRQSSHSTVWKLGNRAALLCQLHDDCLTGPKEGTR